MTPHFCSDILLFFAAERLVQVVEPAAIELQCLKAHEHGFQRSHGFEMHAAMQIDFLKTIRQPGELHQM